jgi:arginyl-tRNA synthetase
MESFAQEIAPLLQNAVHALLPEDAEKPAIAAADLETPPDPKMGDFAFPCFKLAKPLRKGPPVISKELTEAVAAKVDSSRIEVKSVGPYVNFTVKPEVAIQQVLGDILDDAKPYGSLDAESRGTWVMEFSSVNVAKPFMVGHLRSTAIGAALAKAGRLRGWKVVSINHLGDWGTQYGKLAVAIERFGQDLPEPPSINDLVSAYVRFHDEAEKNPELEDEAREAFRKLEEGDEKITALWEKCKNISLKEFDRTYQRLGVEFTHVWGESHYVPEIPKLISALTEKKLLIESEGAMVVPVEDAKGKELPPAIIQKKDGSTIYATRDIAAAIYRWDKYHFDKMTYVVGKEQKLHFQQVFKVLRENGLRLGGPGRAPQLRPLPL